MSASSTQPRCFRRLPSMKKKDTKNFASRRGVFWLPSLLMTSTSSPCVSNGRGMTLIYPCLLSPRRTLPTESSALRASGTLGPYKEAW